MRKKLFPIFITLLFAPYLKANKEAAEQYTYDGNKIIDRPKTVFSDSSKALRENRQIFASVGIGLLSKNARLGYYLTPDSLIEFTYMEQKDFVVGESRYYALGWVYFVENSLFTRSSLAYKLGDTISFEESLKGDREELNQKVLGLDFGIGHTWSINKHVAITAEWASVFFPFYYINKQKSNKDVLVELRIASLGIGLQW